MTTYRLFPSASGPSSPVAYSGNFLAGIIFGVTGKVLWLNGYWWWVPAGGDTGAQKFALWNMTSGTPTQVLISSATVTSGTLTAGQWNYVALATPVQLAPGAQYVAATGWSAVNGFPDTTNQFGSGDPYVNGITNGPLIAWSDGTAGGTNNAPYPFSQGVFSTAGTDPTVNMPDAGSNSANFWMDVEVSDTAPSGYAGSWRLWPNRYDALGYSNDTATNFTLGMEFSLSQACSVNNIWFYSPPGVTQLPTGIGIYEVSGQSLVASNSSPSWTLPGGGAASAGGGWMKAALSGTLSASVNYKAAVVNGAATAAIWNGATADFWSTGEGASGLTAGPISAPDNGAATSPGQDTYNAGASLAYPGTNAGPYNYWVDIEVTPAAIAPPPALPQVMRTEVISRRSGRVIRR